MNFIIPMAGKGQRFVDAGFENPKPLITAFGKKLFEWSIDSLPLELCSTLICIVLKEHCEQFDLDKAITEKYGHGPYHLKLLILDSVTRGQAETVALSEHLWEMDKDLVIFNADTAFESENLAYDLIHNAGDGLLACFESDENRFSYARIDEDGIVVETAEKVAISTFTLNGLYHFKSPLDFISTYNYHVSNNLMVNGEYYVAPMYNYLIFKGKKFRLHTLYKNYILGTPQELQDFNPNI